MRGNKFLSFLILSLSVTAFLAGYIMVSGGLETKPGSRAGTILEQFGGQEEEPAQEQQAEEKLLFPVSERKAISVSNSSDRTGIVYFEKNTGKLYEYNFEDSKERTVSDTMLPNFLSAIWSPVKREVLSVFYSSDTPRIKYHNYDTGKTVGLSSNIRSADFSPDGGLIAYYLTNTASSSEPNKIYISQTDGTYPKKVLDTRIEDLEISWPIKDRLAFRSPNAEIFLLTEEGKLTKLIESKLNLDTRWSVNGSKVLFSYFENLADPVSTLWLKDVELKSERPLNIQTSATRCVWSIDEVNVFCAVAKTPSVDDIYRINTTDGTQKLIVEPDIKIKDIFIPSLEKYLILTNAADDKLYGVKLKP